MEQPVQTIKLKDIALVATLVYFNFPIRETISERVGFSKPFASFVFKETPELLQLIDDFERGRTVVEPRKFASTLKECKTRMYDDLNKAQGGVS